jgi:hypothetical protein
LRGGTESLILQPRDRTVLEKLALLRLLDRRQIEQLAGFHSISRANVRLAKLRHAGLIVRYFTASATGSRRSAYGLTKRGASEIHTTHVPFKWKSDSILLGNSFAAHQLALSDIYLEASRCRDIRWKTFPSPPVSSIPIIPDALIESSAQSFFLEMDLGTEPTSVWNRKVVQYLKLAASGIFRHVVTHPQFAVLVVTDAEERMHLLRRHISKQTQKLFWFQTVSTIQRQGFWSASWLRSEGSALSPPGA